MIGSNLGAQCLVRIHTRQSATLVPLTFVINSAQPSQAVRQMFASYFRVNRPVTYETRCALARLRQ